VAQNGVVCKDARVSPARFSAYPQFNDEDLHAYAGMKHRIHALPAQLFPSDNLPDRLARSLAENRAVHIKELLEAFEFFARVRKRLRHQTMVDLCAGHGLAGLIFALCEPTVERVELVDHKTPASFDRIWKAFVDIAPWVREKVTYRETPLDGSLVLPEGASVLLVHACGALTDHGLQQAMNCGGAVAAMPCCYGKAEPARVGGLSQPFGREAAIDISRTYTLADAGYQVDWGSIPQAITPKNRVLIGWNRGRYRAST
jgi:hypothetical protein